MQNQASLQETKQHGAVRFPFNLYPCTIPGDFQQVALHWHESMELVFVKQGMGLVQVGVVTYPAYRGDIFIFAPGTLHALRQAEGQRMEYENIIFEPELLGGAEDLCAEKYLLPLQSGRLSLPVRLTPNDLCYLQAAACLRELEDANRAKRPGYELLVKGALLRFLALLIASSCVFTTLFIPTIRSTFFGPNAYAATRFAFPSILMNTPSSLIAFTLPRNQSQEKAALAISCFSSGVAALSLSQKL